MYMIQIEEKKMDKLSEHIEESLRHMGKAMQCVDEWMMDNGMGERSGNYGSRGGYVGRGGYGNRYSGGSMGNRYGIGYKDDEEDEWEDEEMMGERRGRRRRDSRGRYM